MRKFVYIACSAALLCTAAARADEHGGDSSKGKEIFDQQCAGCHNADSTEKKMGPGLKGLFAKDKMNNGNKPTYENVMKQVEEGGNGMPGYKELLSDEERKNVLAYLATL